MNPFFKVLTIIFLIFASSGIANGQFLLEPGTEDYNYYRILALKNPDMVQPLSYFPSVGTDYSNENLTWDIWDTSLDEIGEFEVINPRVGYTLNTGANRGGNDGAAWLGKGSNASASFGFQGKFDLGSKSSLSYTFYPVVYYAQNKDFTIGEHNFDKSEYSYPYEYRIDWVQRYGDESVTEFHLGQSEIKYNYRALAVAFSTQNMTWGPSYENQFLMSRNAGGFPHLNIGTNTPVDTKIGKFEVQALWGRLQESDYFDEDSSNDRRYFTGLIAAFNPSFIKNLTLSGQRILYRTWEDGVLDTGDYFAAFYNFSPKRDTELDDGRVTNDLYDQIASVSISWRFPEAGFETYLEYAKDDFPASFQEFMRVPDRLRAYTFGFVKLFDLSNGHLIRILIESASLSNNQTKDVGDFSESSYYIHGIVLQGFTHNGQLIGSSIGPGSNNNYASLDYYFPTGMFGAYFQRIRYNDDYTFRTFIDDIKYRAEFDINFGFKGAKHFDQFSIYSHLSCTYLNNWYFSRELSRWNISPNIQIRYRL